MKIEIVRNNGTRAFSWTSGKERDTPTKTMPRRPGSRDMTGGFVANDKMLLGLYHGNYPGLQFASALCFTPINLLVQMMGYPTPIAEDDDPVTQAALDYILRTMSDRIPRIHATSLLLGNDWIYPRFDAKDMTLAWEAIPDSCIPELFADIGSERLIALRTDEQIALTVGENNNINAQRKRLFTPSAIEVKWYGQKPAGVVDISAANISGMLPVNFAHDADEGSFRGWSLFSRVIRNMKDYHDIAYRISETLAKFKVKQVQEVDDPSVWLDENDLENDCDWDSYDVAENDFVLNRRGDTTKFEFLGEGATAGMEKALERIFLTIVEGTGAPELFWGGLATGNHASTDVQLQQAVDYAASKRKAFTSQWEAILNGSLRIMSIIRGETYKPFAMGWNRLEAVSPEMKSQILLRFSQSLAALMGSAVCTPQQMHTLWEINFPESKPGDFETWRKGISEMALHKQFVGEMYGAGVEDFNARGGESE